ncbi:MAG: type II toxin-antitoxin system VapC family toxin [Clostridia bacterium]
MIYLDSSALVKLIRDEPETPALIAWLNDRASVACVSSCLAEVEVARALRRHDPAALATMPAVMARVYRVEIDARIRARAAAYDDLLLPSLDAIHLATADVLISEGQPLDALVAYDDRLLAAASARDWPTSKPGASEPG